MTSEMTRPAAARVLRWLEDSPAVIRGVRESLAERDQL